VLGVGVDRLDHAKGGALPALDSRVVLVQGGDVLAASLAARLLRWNVVLRDRFQEATSNTGTRPKRTYHATVMSMQT
jgi:hypothetical protein